MKSMLDIFKERLPDDVSIVSVQDRSGSSLIKIKIAYGEIQADAYLQKTYAPGLENLYCDFAVSVVMIKIALQRNDLEMAKCWKEKQQKITYQIKQAKNEDS